MDPSDNFATRYAGLTGPQFAANDVLANLRAALYSPTPAATFPNDPNGAPTAPTSLPIPPSQPAMWLSPDGSVSYTGRPPGASANASGANNLLGNNAATLMALGGGIARGGIGQGLTQAASAAEADRSRQAQQVNLLQTYNALTNGGVPPQEARLAVSNPSVMRAVAMKYFGRGAQANAPAAPPTIPSPPPGVPKGVAYSPSRCIWKHTDGTCYDGQGQKVP